MIVDVARMPVYLVSEVESLMPIGPTILLVSVAVLVGTVVGERSLRYIPESWFRRSVAGIILALGAFMLYRTFS